MDVIARNNVTVAGVPDGQPMVFAHGFGCDQNMWRYVAPEFEGRFRTVLFDHVGAGHSDLNVYNVDKYGSLSGYASDVVEICEALNLENVIFVGHSVSSMIGVLAANARPNMFSHLVLIGPSPRYINDVDYFGGFSAEDIDGLLETLDSNYLGWSRSMAPVIMANADRPELGEELTNSFCRTDPAIAKRFARTTFLSDNRADLEAVTVPSLILQCSVDAIAPLQVGQYVHSRLANSQFVVLDAEGHCPNLSSPQETVRAINEYLASSS